ncbi:hypothetical protein [Corynebacterium variabile]|uniref:hypothetical protein n=1 Tax=Corynebacterium variabile TaxID=1727 RepID=UPI0028AE3968|nr:hypothetical protein [Corynebacterium variabile]
MDVELEGGDAEVDGGLEGGPGLLGVLTAAATVCLQVEGGREVVDGVRTRDARKAAGDATG